MRRLMPSEKVRERFRLIYELQRAQKTTNFLTRYYGIRPMKIILDGRRVGTRDVAYYFENGGYFTKRGLNKLTILYELYHHIAYANGLDESERKEEQKPDRYARKLTKGFA